MWIIVEKMGKKWRETAETGGRTGGENQEKIRFSTNLSTISTIVENLILWIVEKIEHFKHDLF